jgi:hypothetical protein
VHHLDAQARAQRLRQRRLAGTAAPDDRDAPHAAIVAR